MPEFLVEILRNDIHPFVYFLLVKVWMAPFPGSDAWALASSLVTGFASVAVLAWVANRCYGPRAALWAAAIYCVLPNFAWAAANLRMYSLIPALVVMVWYCNREVLRVGASGGRVFAMLLFQLVLAYTHAIEIFFVAFVVLSAGLEQHRNASRKSKITWLCSQIGAGLCMLPLVVPALVRGTEPLPVPSLINFVLMPAQLISGWALSNDVAGLIGGGVVFVALLAFALTHRAARIMVVVIPCCVLVAALAIGSLGKPMFKPPVFTANVVPFLVLSAAAGVVVANRLLVRGAALGLVLILAVATWPWAGRLVSNGNFEVAARYVRDAAKPGDLVIVPGLSTFWGVARYAVGPLWGKPLDVMPLKDNAQWSRLKERLGARLVSFLGLDPGTDMVEARGVRYVVGGDASRHQVSPQATVFVVHRRRYPEQVSVGFSVAARKVTWFEGDISVSAFQSAEQGPRTIENPPYGDGR